MNQDKFNEVIDFAIAREKEAVQFYFELQSEVKFRAQNLLSPRTAAVTGQAKLFSD